MKTNWKYAIMAFAVTFSLAACNTEEPKPVEDPEEDEPAFVSPITVDGNFADWDALDASKVVSATTVADAYHSALTSVKVYADKMYINLLVEFDANQITDKEWVPFHIYLNSDNSSTTGGYGDQFLDANTDYLMEGGIFSAGEAISYNPALFKWWGAVGENGWLWTDPATEHSDADFWGAIIGEGQGAIGTSATTGNKLEIQILREATPIEFASTFGIGVDIQQNWSSVGILPNAAAVDGAAVYANKLSVTIDNAE